MSPQSKGTPRATARGDGPVGTPQAQPEREAGRQRWGKEGWRGRVREADLSKGIGVRMNSGPERKMSQKGREGERNAGAES